MNPQKKRRQDSEKQQLILQRNSQLHGVLLAALLAVVLLVFGLVNLLHTKRDFSENENRKLQAYPALTAASVLDGSFMSKLQSAFADQFFARDHWISAKLRIDQLLGQKESNGVYLCQDNYLIEIPEAHVRDGVFYRTDHHWTSLGAYCVFDASAELLGIETPITNYRVHVLTNSFEGTLASKSGKHTAEDTITAYEPLGTDVSYYVLYDSTREKAGSVFVDSALDTKDKYTVFFGGNHPLVTIKTTANNGKILLIFKDSYANSFVPFLIPYYQQIVMIDPRYYYDDVEQLMTQRGVTDVLFLYNLSTFSADTALADTLGAAS